MKRFGFGAVAALAALMVSQPGLAQTGEKVTSYLGTTVRTFTDKGEPNGRLEVAKLPKLPADVVGTNNGHPGVKLADGSIVYLKPADIETKGGDTGCAELAVASKGANTRLAASEVGVSHGMSANAVRCVRK